jgi:hypothetical protein
MFLLRLRVVNVTLAVALIKLGQCLIGGTDLLLMLTWSCVLLILAWSLILDFSWSVVCCVWYVPQWDLIHLQFPVLVQNSSLCYVLMCVLTSHNAPCTHVHWIVSGFLVELYRVVEVVIERLVLDWQVLGVSNSLQGLVTVTSIVKCGECRISDILVVSCLVIVLV